ncbi:GNAT family N-acetyltransferase [Saccharopolyspora gloriosae]|uniref:GNAT superfamily N-acetyltransferase n=1 Tax=Saccharopolyspora gloriosae TaxID=455344 RepID=A0A840NGW7_9PSEU|nr:GNAT family N-acetyltransferase [Saccharopolyspora gloriosae]MBB5069473.1 GNAT superfamily N-acetyltransferase [Saccharopolyspora gloriosae]
MQAETDVRARTLVSAFVDDAVSRWLVPDADAREQVYLDWFDLVVEHADRVGAVKAAGPVVEVWLRGTEGEPPRMLDEEGERRMAESAAPFLDRIGALGELTGARHPLEAHWYLSLIGVVPDHQRTGVGTAALAASLREYDRAGLPTYLEASSLASRALYSRLGFADLGGPIELPGGPELYPMWREVGGRGGERR